MYKFQTLIIWQKGSVLVRDIFKLSNNIPSQYRYSLRDQLVRSALSITNNVAEGSGRITKKDKRYFYSISQGSLLEVVNMLLLMQELGIIKDNKIKDLLALTEELSKMLHAIISNLS